MLNQNNFNKRINKSKGLISVAAAVILATSLMVSAGAAMAHDWKSGQKHDCVMQNTAATSTELPREWRFERNAINFDSMFRNVK